MLRRHKQSDADLVRQVLAGRREDFGELVERHLPAAFAVAYGRTGNHADAEDAAQEAFLRALKTLDRLREPAKFGPWLLTIARNVATDILVVRTRERNAGTPTPNEDDASWLPNMEQREMWSKLHEQIRQLDNEPREVLLLFYFAGKPTKEIAALLNLTHDAVRKRLQRAREILGTHLLEELQPERKLEPVFKRHSATVTAAALAAPIAWQTASAATIPAIAGIALGKWLAGIILISVAGVAALVVMTDENRERAPSPTPEGIYDSLLSDLPQPETDPDGPVTRADPIAVTPAQDLTSGPIPATDVIRGQVVDAETGEGVNVGVTFTGDVFNGSEIRPDTNDDGTFEIDTSNYGYGAFTVSCETGERYEAAHVDGERQQGEPVPYVMLRLHELATISGYVFRPDGTPVPHASIMRRELRLNIDTKGSADENGYYEIHHDGGNLALAASQGWLVSDFTDFNLAKNESVTHDFVLPESGEIHLTLHTSDNAAIDNISDSVLMTEERTAPRLMANKVSDNEFVTKDLPDDVYAIVVRAEGYEPAEIAGIRIDRDHPKASVTATLRRSTLYDVTVRVLTPEGQPLPGVGVILMQLTERLHAAGNAGAKLENQVAKNGLKTGDNGEWTASVPAGYYRAFCAGQATRGETRFTVPDTLSATLQLVDPEDPVHYRLELLDGLDDNKPLGLADVYTGFVHADGTITDRLIAGVNHIAVVKEGYTAHLDTIAVTEEPSTAPIVVRAILGEGGTIEGQVHDSDGTPKIWPRLLVFPELLWSLAPEDWSGSWIELGVSLGQRAQTDTSGNFSIGHLPQGRYVIALDENRVSMPIEVVPGMVAGPVEIVAD